MDLHIGVTNSEGSVVEFDKGGLQQHRTGMWYQCLVVHGAAGPWREHWDTTLKAVIDQKCWLPQRYVPNSASDGTKLCCHYDSVLFAKYYRRDQIVKDEVGGAYIML